MSKITVKIAKLNTTHTFDTELLPEASREYGMEYGLTQSINDSHASIARKNFETEAKFLEAVADRVRKRIEQILSGNVPGKSTPMDERTAKVKALTKDMDDATFAQFLAAVEAESKKKAAPKKAA